MMVLNAWNYPREQTMPVMAAPHTDECPLVHNIVCFQLSHFEKIVRIPQHSKLYRVPFCRVDK